MKVRGRCTDSASNASVADRIPELIAARMERFGSR